MQGTFQRMISLLNQPLVSARTMRERRRRKHAPNRTLKNTDMHSAKESIVLRGELMAGVNTQYAVDGRDIIVTGDTWVFGDLLIGMNVAAQCLKREDGGVVAKKVILID